ncbi:type II toxin-antitoxin system Phd/YefM family antitoxin, partial [Staphylococcus pseudintermedius]
MIIKTPTNARKEFYELLKQVNDNHEPIIISGSKSENNT